MLDTPIRCATVAFAVCLGWAGITQAAQLRLANTPIELHKPDHAATASLSLALPGGQVVRSMLPDGADSTLPLPQGTLTDGLYRYEITWSAASKSAADGLENGRVSSATRTDMSGSPERPPEPHVVSGSFRVVDGHVLAPTEQPEPGSEPHVHATTPSAVNDQIIADDLIVQGSACVGFDCANGENFGFDTIRIKENNTAINFTDTSNSASFPSNDWTLQANDTTNGGMNRFMIKDATNNKIPFSVQAGARNDALFIDDSNKIGFGTSTPVLPLHLKWSNTPALRLEQDNSGGWGAQTWDVAANEANFFIRDVNHGSSMPFRIQSGAAYGSLVIGLNGNVGIGLDHAFPDTPLDVRHNQAAATPVDVIRVTNSDGSIAAGQTDRFTVDSNGNVTARGTIVQLSSRTVKDNFTPVDDRDVLARVAALRIGTWNYKTDPASDRHMGPVAEDFHQQFGLGGSDNRHIAVTDMGGVALAAVQALQKELDTRDKLIKALEQRISQLEAMQGAHPTAQQ